MIPLRLELRNFMSYGEDVPPLDLTGMRTICLSGDNGHGKSALLDAITWSLWGESRAGKNKHDELVRLGADEMSVSFTFEMDTQTFRVLRKRSKRASGNQWELQQQTAEMTWRSLTGNNSGETERAIHKLLRMSYDTFLNSAYLRQGQADQFVRQSPGKRKEILGEILDLSRYDKLEAKAREIARTSGAEATDHERDLNGMEAELAQEPILRASLETISGQISLLQGTRDQLRAEWELVRDRKVLLETQRQTAEGLAQQSRALEHEIKELQTEIVEAATEVNQAHLLIGRKDKICHDYTLLGENREHLERLHQDLDRLHRLQQMLAAAEKEWMAAENEVQRQAERAITEHQQAEGRLHDLPLLTRDHDLLSKRLSACASLQTQRDENGQNLDKATEKFQALREENARLDLQIKQWEERLELLNQQQGVCTVCNAPLPPERITQTREDYQHELSQAQTLSHQVRQQASLCKKQMAQLQTDGKALDADLRAAAEDNIRMGQLEQRLLELEAVQTDLPHLLEVRTAAEKKWNTRAFAPDIRAKMEKHGTELKALSHVERDYAAARDQAALLADAERQYLALQQSQATLTTAEGRKTRAERSLRQRQETVAAIDQQMSALAGVPAEIAQAEARSQEIRSVEAERAAQERLLTEQQTRQQVGLDHCEALKAKRIETQQHLSKAKKIQEAHEQLARAFGKKGVQALIIENAIPELQEEANRLLERLTDGEMALFFETLRDAKTKKSAPIETLDIKVSDNLGTRPLEMYSGGEGFRAAFALRIALSKLLAHRAGAQLQTLIIDEGFGTQDGKGREKLIEAVNTIQEDFEKIIVITHIDELKDAFASRIEVTKTASGSQFTIMEGAAG